MGDSRGRRRSTVHIKESQIFRVGKAGKQLLVDTKERTELFHDDEGYVTLKKSGGARRKTRRVSVTTRKKYLKHNGNKVLVTEETDRHSVTGSSESDDDHHGLATIHESLETETKQVPRYQTKRFITKAIHQIHAPEHASQHQTKRYFTEVHHQIHPPEHLTPCQKKRYRTEAHLQINSTEQAHQHHHAATKPKLYKHSPTQAEEVLLDKTLDQYGHHLEKTTNREFVEEANMLAETVADHKKTLRQISPAAARAERATVHAAIKERKQDLDAMPPVVAATEKAVIELTIADHRNTLSVPVETSVKTPCKSHRVHKKRCDRTDNHVCAYHRQENQRIMAEYRDQLELEHKATEIAAKAEHDYYKKANSINVSTAMKEKNLAREASQLDQKLHHETAIKRINEESHRDLDQLVKIQNAQAELDAAVKADTAKSLKKVLLEQKELERRRVHDVKKVKEDTARKAKLEIAQTILAEEKHKVAADLALTAEIESHSVRNLARRIEGKIEREGRVFIPTPHRHVAKKPEPRLIKPASKFYPENLPKRTR